MDDIVDQSVLGNALQRISELERIGQHQLNTDPPQAEATNQTNDTNAVEELYQRFPTRVKTHKLLQVCKQVVTSLFTSC